MRGGMRTIVMVALPGVQLLDVSGPLDVFAEANAQAGHEAYRLLVASAEPSPIRSSSGVRLMPDRIIDRDLEEPIDTLLVAGCPNAAVTPAAVRTGPSATWIASSSTVTSGNRPASSSATAQCVVTRRPSSRPVAARKKAPLHTEP